MEIYVCVKQVPDTETKIKLSSDGKGVDLTGTKWVINPYDEFAIEEALKLKAQNAGATVTVISTGPKAQVSETLRTALAMGADEAAVIDSPEPLDSLATAKALAAFLKDKKPTVIFTGKTAIDDNAMAVPQILADQLQIPHATVVSKFEFKGESVLVEREVEGGSREIIELRLPAVIAANKGLNTPRYASLPGIMKAKKKTLQEVSASQKSSDSKVVYSDYQLPADRPSCKILSGEVPQQVSELVKALREEVKVI